MKSLSYIVNHPFRTAITERRLIFHVACILALASLHADGLLASEHTGDTARSQVELGRALFTDTSLSHDGRTSCRSCHDPQHAYADSRPRSIGSDGRTGTRNAPSLIGVGSNTAFFWDGRRTTLEVAVIDPFTNPVELDLASTTDVLAKLRDQPSIMEQFRAAFPGQDAPSIVQVSSALARFVRSLSDERHIHASDLADTQQNTLSAEAQSGRRLFEGAAGCNECHASTHGTESFSDGQYHHSDIGAATTLRTLPELVQSVIASHLDANALGPKVLSDGDWSALGRFVVTHVPADIGAFRTPSLRNVALTAPYMHDGSIPTLADAVDHEIYYHALSSGHPVNLTQRERQSIVTYLETLTDRSR